MPVVIADASPLVALSLIHRLDLFPKLFGEVQMVQAVMNEVLTDQFSESEDNVRAAIKRGWLSLADTSLVSADGFDPKQLMSWRQLDAGEAQSIAYAASLKQTALLLMDERAGKQLCDELGLATLGTAGILLSAKSRGLIALVRPELERLHQVGFWLSPAMTKMVLKTADELR